MSDDERGSSSSGNPTNEPGSNHDRGTTASRNPFAGLSAEQAYQLGQHAQGQPPPQGLAGNYQGVGGGTIGSRSELQRLTQSTSQFNGDRDLYKTLGYSKEIGIEAYLQRYLRQDIAQRIVNAPADKTWSEWPDLTDDDDSEEETAFEADMRALKEDVHALKALRDTDRYSGIGHVGALVIGFSDGQKLSESVDPAPLQDQAVEEAIAYLTPCHEKAIKSITLVDDETDPRFGEPEAYQIDFSEMDSLTDSTVSVTNKREERTVHHSRVVLVDYERPRLEPVMNRLMDLEKVTGASAELFWRGADYGLALNMDSEAAAQMGTEQRRELQEDIEEEAEAYYHGLQPFLQLAAVDVERLGGEDVDPTGIADLILQLISGTIQMPKRILTGSERGELASTQDKATWLGHISERQQNESEPHLLRPFIDRLRKYGVVAEPQSERYDANWPNLFELNEVEEAEVMAQKATAFKTAADGLLASGLAMEGEVRQEILGWEPEIGSEIGKAPSQNPEEPVASDPTEGEAPGDRVDETDPEVRAAFQEGLDSPLPGE